MTVDSGPTGRQWCGLALVVAGIGFGLGFFFVPPQVLIPELVRQPNISVPEALVGLWLIGIGVVLLVTGRRSRGHQPAGGPEQPKEPE